MSLAKGPHTIVEYNNTLYVAPLLQGGGQGLECDRWGPDAAPQECEKLHYLGGLHVHTCLSHTEWRVMCTRARVGSVRTCHGCAQVVERAHPCMSALRRG